MNKLNYLLPALASVMLASCSDEGPIEQISNESFPLTIVFDGVTYNVDAKLQNDSLIYLDENFSRIYNEQIRGRNDYAVLAYKAEDGHDIIEYYPSAEELESKNGIEFVEPECLVGVSTRSGIDDPVTASTIGRAILYDDTNYKDREVVLNIDCNYWISIGSLKQYASFNDKTSAIRVFNFLSPNTSYVPSYFDPITAVNGGSLRTCLIGFEDSNFEGKRLYCISNTYSTINYVVDWDKAYHQDWKLGNIGWNDKISSVQFRIINVSDINSGLYTLHNPC